MKLTQLLKDHSTIIMAILGLAATCTTYVLSTGSGVTHLQRDHQLMVRDVAKIDERVARLEVREYQFAIWQAQVVEQLKSINEKLDRMGHQR